jgi:hypothetical protein
VKPFSDKVLGRGTLKEKREAKVEALQIAMPNGT